MILCSNDLTFSEDDEAGFDFAFYLFILRLLAWIYALLKRCKIWVKRRALGKKTYPELPLCYSRNEFGYVDMNGAY